MYREGTEGKKSREEGKRKEESSSKEEGTPRGDFKQIGEEGGQQKHAMSVLLIS
jgi:hypothetical protein